MKNWANITYRDTNGCLHKRREHNYVTQAGCMGLLTEFVKDPINDISKAWYIGTLSSIVFSTVPSNLTTLTSNGYSFVVMDDGSYYVEYSMAPQFLGGGSRTRSQIIFDPTSLSAGQINAPNIDMLAFGITHMSVPGEVDSQVNGLFITSTGLIGGVITDPIAVIIFKTPLSAVGSDPSGISIFIDYTFDLLGQ